MVLTRVVVVVVVEYLYSASRSASNALFREALMAADRINVQ